MVISYFMFSSNCFFVLLCPFISSSCNTALFGLSMHLQICRETELDLYLKKLKTISSCSVIQDVAKIVESSKVCIEINSFLLELVNSRMQNS